MSQLDPAALVRLLADQDRRRVVAALVLGATTLDEYRKFIEKAVNTQLSTAVAHGELNLVSAQQVVKHPAFGSDHQETQ